MKQKSFTDDYFYPITASLLDRCRQQEGGKAVPMETQPFEYLWENRCGAYWG